MPFYYECSDSPTQKKKKQNKKKTASKCDIKKNVWVSTLAMYSMVAC